MNMNALIVRPVINAISTVLPKYVPMERFKAIMDKWIANLVIQGSANDAKMRPWLSLILLRENV